MSTATAEPSTTRQVGANGEIYLGARADALAFRDSIQDQRGLEMVMRALATDLERVSELADLLLKYAYEDAPQLDRCFLLGTALAFYPTVEVDTKQPTELTGTPLTAAQLAYWQEQLTPAVASLLKTAYDNPPLALSAAGRAVELFLDGLPSREARVAGLTLVLQSDLTPYQAPPAIEPEDEAALDALLREVQPVIEELVFATQRTRMTNVQVVGYAYELARRAELTDQQTQVVVAGAVGMMADMRAINLTFTCPGGHTKDESATADAAAQEAAQSGCCE